MAFLTAIPAELLSAAAQLEGIGTALSAQNAGAAAPTTSIVPAASDQVSLLQAGVFSAYGTLYQQIAAEAHTIQQQFTSTLGLSSANYGSTEAANASSTTAQSGFQDFLSGLSTALGGPDTSFASGAGPFSLSGNFANMGNIGAGNYASAASDLLGLAGGGLLPSAPADAGADAGADAAAGAADAAAAGSVSPAGVGAVGMPTAGIGQATMVGSMSAPPSWASAVTPVSSPGVASALQGATLTSGAAHAAPGVVPGMPGMASAGRNSAGFGAPRYGVKPIVMKKLGLATV